MWILTQKHLFEAEQTVWFFYFNQMAVSLAFKSSSRHHAMVTGDLPGANAKTRKVAARIQWQNPKSIEKWGSPESPHWKCPFPTKNAVGHRVIFQDAGEGRVAPHHSVQAPRAKVEQTLAARRGPTPGDHLAPEKWGAHHPKHEELSRIYRYLFKQQEKGVKPQKFVDKLGFHRLFGGF